MKKGKILLILMAFCFVHSFAQVEETVLLRTDSGNLEGTILVPETNDKIPVVLIIAGSGPTDRDGNNPMMKNNSLKMLAEELSKNNIASLRYDKRGIANSVSAGMKEPELRFENYIDDAEGWINFLEENFDFKDITIIGHSEGSLIGMIASQQSNVTRFISIAGAGQSADKTIKEQLSSQPPAVLEQSLPIIDKLVKGDTVGNVPQMLYSLFRPSVQPYIISWFKYDPQIEIAKLEKPVLIIQGSTDIQIKAEDAERLAEANKEAKLEMIEGMNHILKEAEMDRQKNIETYTDPDLPVKQELIRIITEFIKAE